MTLPVGLLVVAQNNEVSAQRRGDAINIGQGRRNLDGYGAAAAQAMEIWQRCSSPFQSICDRAATDAVGE
jgi:hypothetical protein